MQRHVFQEILSTQSLCTLTSPLQLIPRQHLTLNAWTFTGTNLPWNDAAEVRRAAGAGGGPATQPNSDIIC